MRTLKGTFTSQLLKDDLQALQVQRQELVAGLFTELTEINSLLEKVGSEKRFKLMAAGGISGEAYYLREFWDGKSGSSGSSNVMGVEFSLRTPDIHVSYEEYGDPPYKGEPEQILQSFSYDAIQSVKDLMVTKMREQIAGIDIHEIKVLLANQPS